MEASAIAELEQTIHELPLDPIWRQAAKDALAEFKYGDVIPWEWLTVMLDIHQPDEKLTALEHRAMQFDILTKVDGFKDEMLTKHQRYLINIRGVGYKIIEPPHQTAAAMIRLQKELRRSIAQAMSALVNVNDKALSLEDAKENTDARNKLGAFATLHLKQLERNPAKEKQP